MTELEKEAEIYETEIRKEISEIAKENNLDNRQMIHLRQKSAKEKLTLMQYGFDVPIRTIATKILAEGK